MHEVNIQGKKKFTPLLDIDFEGSGIGSRKIFDKVSGTELRRVERVAGGTDGVVDLGDGSRGYYFDQSSYFDMAGRILALAGIDYSIEIGYKPLIENTYVFSTGDYVSTPTNPGTSVFFNNVPGELVQMFLLTSGSSYVRYRLLGQNAPNINDLVITHKTPTTTLKHLNTGTEASGATVRTNPDSYFNLGGVRNGSVPQIQFKGYLKYLRIKAL